MAKHKKQITRQKDLELEKVRGNLEKTGEALGSLFQGLFKGLGKILDVAQEMEIKGERKRSYQKEIKGVTKTGKEFQGQAGWKIRTGLLETPSKKRKRNK